MTIIPYFPKGDYGEIGLRGDLFVIELPEGEYEVYSWEVGSGVANVRPTQPVSVKYKVERGKAIYAGNYNFVQTDSMGFNWMENFFTSRIQGIYRVIVFDPYFKFRCFIIPSTQRLANH